MDNVALCICGCGKPATKGQWYPGHWNRGKKHEQRASRGSKVRVKKTPEERSAIAKAMWDKRGRKEIILNPCSCGCEEMVKGEWAWGHHSRVNNVSKREDIKELRRQNMTNLHDEGKMPEAWNKGLTAETDSRVKLNIENLMITVRSAEHRQMHSDLMHKHRLDGTIPTLTGSAHSQWKGGSSEITQIIRGSGELYRQWRRPILIRDGFKCIQCGKTDDLNVHHDKERMAEIIHKIKNSFISSSHRDPDVELSWEEKKYVADSVIDYHVSQNTSGITLCFDCHMDLHHREGTEDLD